MSRIGKLPVTIPEKVEVDIQGTTVKVKGPKGQLEWTFAPEMIIEKADNQVVVKIESEEKRVRSLFGTTRSLIQNMVTGVHDGFQKIIEVRGVGYRAEMNGDNLVLHVGYSHPVEMTPPQGISFEVDSKVPRASGSDGLNCYVHVNGIDKALVGQIASDVRKVRPPNVYKGKGLRYKGEYVKILPGKAGKVG
ncbi:MAG TPA: 50S ribosomal protein L6 [Chloroflexi bacterium]|jgi:large subunit ribosomal protein L6|nr:50S ribosomal protein L6 [Chloroflexota bacterium]